MTRKDFEWFANFVVDFQLDSAAEAELMRFFAKKNPRFSFDIWRTKVEKLQDKRRELLYG